MYKFYSLTLRDIDRDNNAVIWSFEIPENLKTEFSYKAGQHLTFKSTHNGEEIRRCYSICSSANSSRLKVLIKEVADGRFSVPAQSQYQVGDVLEVMPPTGHFSLKPENSKTYVAFAAGSGITPVMGMMYAAMEQTENAQFILFYGNRSFADILLQKQLSNLKDRFGSRLSLHYFFSRQQVDIEFYQGRFTGEKVKYIVNNLLQDIEVSGYYVCGPGGMIDDVCESLQQLGVQDSLIHNERFLSDGQEISANEKTVHQDTGITVTLDGANYQFEIKAGEQTTLLESAELSGVALPYSCKAGVCATCRCKLLDGKVEMINNYSLEQWEIDDGYILGCQSVPKSSKIHISYDA